jgi:hypothetical protein
LFAAICLRYTGPPAHAYLAATAAVPHTHNRQSPPSRAHAVQLLQVNIARTATKLRVGAAPTFSVLILLEHRRDVALDAVPRERS